MAEQTKTTGNHIFRIHDDGASDIRLECWGLSSKLDSNRIRTIKDTIRKGSSKVATSVPSPFARMYLFDTAFKMVSEQLDGDTVYHQLVSDCLDIFQFLFNAGNGDANIKFKQWNRNERINKLKDNPEGHPHRLLADSLELFFTNKFSNVQDITLIYYKDILLGGTSPFTVFFTSPNWHREMEENRIVIASTTGDVYFDLDYTPLHLRDKMFVEFIWKFYLSHRSILNEKCDGFSTYIINTIAKHNKELERKMNNEWDDYINNPQKLEDDYQRINVIPNSSTYLQVNHLFAYAVKSGGISSKIESESDFLMITSSDNYKNELDADNNPTNPLKPLVLLKGMNVPGTFTYDNTPWDPTTDIRRNSIFDTYGEPLPLVERYLPGNSQIQYPFITTEDFLEDNLVKMPFKLNNKKFLTGYSGDFNFLLPIKKQYFNFFTIEDLHNKNLEIIPLDNKITVKLKIPIRNRKGISFVIMTKDYDLENIPAAQCKAGLAIYPFYKIMDAEKIRRRIKEIEKTIRENNEAIKKSNNNSSLAENIKSLEEQIKVLRADLESKKKYDSLNDYTVLLADRNDKLRVDGIEFWQTNDIVAKKSIDVKRPEPRTKKGISAASNYYKVNSGFDLIEVKLSDEGNKAYSGLIIPQFKEIYNQESTKTFTFAIDFGTSNTHIAYTDIVDDKKPKTFDISESDIQMVLLNKPGDSKIVAEKYRMGYDSFPEIDILVNREFVPAIIGKEFNSHVVFPIKTSTCEKKTFSSEKTDLFTNINVGFYMDSEKASSDFSYTTNLKWLFESPKDTKDTERIKSYIKQLLEMVKNKVILNNGSLADLKITYMLPLSMDSTSADNFKELWENTFREVFKSSCNNLPERITESAAPYYFLKFNEGEIGIEHDKTVNIDIGGGTTDILFIMKGKGVSSGERFLSTSFKFAGNDIWGDGFNRNKKDNGFIKNFLKFREKNKQAKEICDDIFDSFLQDKSYTSEDTIGILFRYDDHFKFIESIKKHNTELKVIFYIHYCSIIYHILQILETNKLEIPRYFTFTGKGSQYISLLCNDSNINRLTKELLRVFTDKNAPEGFKVLLIPNPKEATANGAVILVNEDENEKRLYRRVEDDGKTVEVFHWGSETSYSVNLEKGISKNKEIISNQEFCDSTLKNSQSFINRIFTDLALKKFLSDQGIKKYDEYLSFFETKDVTKSGILYDSFYSALNYYKKKEGEAISETFFFLTLKDAVYSLSKKITEQ